MAKYKVTLTNGKAMTLEATAWFKQGNAVTFFQGLEEVDKLHAEAVERIEVMGNGASFVAYRRHDTPREPDAPATE